MFGKHTEPRPLPCALRFFHSAKARRAQPLPAVKEAPRTIHPAHLQTALPPPGTRVALLENRQTPPQSNQSAHPAGAACAGPATCESARAAPSLASPPRACSQGPRILLAGRQVPPPFGHQRLQRAHLLHISAQGGVF